MYDHRVFVRKDRGARRQVENVLRRQVTVDPEILDVQVQLVRNHIERDFDFNRVNELFDDAAIANADCFATQFDGHVNLHLLAGPNAEQIDVQHLLAKHIPLHVLQQGFARGIAVQVDDLRAVAERGLNLVGSQREADRLLAVAVQNCGQPPRATEPLVVALAA